MTVLPEFSAKIYGTLDFLNLRGTGIPDLNNFFYGDREIIAELERISRGKVFLIKKHFLSHIKFGKIDLVVAILVISIFGIFWKRKELFC